MYKILAKLLYNRLRMVIGEVDKTVIKKGGFEL